MSAKKKRRTKTPQANLRRDAAALLKLVTNTARKIRIGRPLVMVVSVVDPRGNALAAMMIKGPPPPPLRLVKDFLGFVTASARKIKAGQPLVMVATVVDTHTNGFAALMVKGPPPPPMATAMMIKGAPPPPA